MSTELIVHGQEAKTVDEMKAQVGRIQGIMEHVMKKNEHYGTVPGCGNKMTLLKPGAEKILATFGIAVDPEVEDLSRPDEIRYRVRCVLRAAGHFVGAGIGECSSSEEKYKWKKPSCKEEFEATDEDRKRIKWFKGYQGAKAYSGQQIRTEPADVANTVLKMAKKRAMIDATLTATAASDIFVQDIEDVEIPDSGEQAPPPPIAQPQPKAAAGNVPVPTEKGDITEPQMKKLQAMLGGLNIKDDLEKHAKVSEMLGFNGVIETFANLTKAHASKLFDAIEAEQKAAK